MRMRRISFIILASHKIRIDLMRPQRLSYEPAGAAVWMRAEVPAAARSVTLVLTPAVQAAPLEFGRSPAQVRQRRIVVATMLVAHAVAILGLLNAGRLRDVVGEARPVFLAVVDTPTAIAPPKPLPPPPTAKVPTPLPVTLPLIAVETSTAPVPLLTQAVASPPPAPEASAEPATAPAPVLPKTIPPSAVQYLVPPAPVYSRISAKMRESGKAIVRVYIDEAGLPRNVQLAASTGFSRLDDAALAAVRNCRFRPYLENGTAVAGWAAIPIEFELPT